MEEVWKPVVGYEGYYEVNNYCDVRSVGRYISNGRGVFFKKGENKKASTNKDGYGKVLLHKKGKSKLLSVHRLGMEAFVPNPCNLPCVNHKDENPSNNFIFVNPDGSVDLEKSNLEWCSFEYNSSYGTKGQRTAKGNSKPVLAFKNDIFIKRFESTKKAAEELYVSRSGICMCLKGSRKSIKGYTFKYEETP